MKYIFQCRFYDSENTIGVGAIRELLGVKASDPTIDKAIFVTSSVFSSKAVDFAKSNGIELIDGRNLFEMVEGLSKKPDL